MRYRIGEFAELGGVSTKTLRFYDRIGLLRPASADPRTRYRFYVPEQLLDLATILSLKDLGANLHGIQQLIQSGKSPQARKRLLQTLRDSLSQTIADQACLLQNIEQALRDADGGSPEIPVVVKRRPPIWIASIRARVSSYAEMTQHETTLTSSLPRRRLETLGAQSGIGVLIPDCSKVSPSSKSDIARLPKVVTTYDSFHPPSSLLPTPNRTRLKLKMPMTQFERG